jgi:hypothetical protein
MNQIGGTTQFIGNVVYREFSANPPFAYVYATPPIVIMIGYLLVARTAGAPGASDVPAELDTPWAASPRRVFVMYFPILHRAPELQRGQGLYAAAARLHARGGAAHTRIRPARRLDASPQTGVRDAVCARARHAGWLRATLQLDGRSTVSLLVAADRCRAS